jgi:hypothetical protein
MIPIASEAGTAPKKVKIAVKEFPPLVFKDLKGFCASIWPTIFAKIIISTLLETDRKLN